MFTKDKKSRLSKALTVAFIVAIGLSASSVKVNAIGSVNIIGSPENSKLDAFTTSDDGTITRATFNSNGQTYADWYNNQGDSSMVFLRSYKRFTYYSPMPAPGDANLSNIRSFAQDYENANQDPGGVSETWTLYDPSYPNFKVYSANANDTSTDNLSSGGGTFNAVEPYSGTSGEYRYLGYSSFGSTVTNPYFPSDYNSHYNTIDYGYDESPWDMAIACPGGASVWDNPENPQMYNEKIEAIYLLEQQHPEMSQLYDLTDWAKHLSLRTDPTKTSAVFVGSRGGHSYYRTLVLEGDPRNLRVVSTVVRDKATNEIMGYDNMNADDPNNYTHSLNAIKPLVVGDDYTVEVTVKNMSNIPTTSNPSLIDGGYGYGAAATSSVYGFADNQFQTVAEQDSVYAGGAEKTFTWDLSFDESVGKALRVTSVIDKVHFENAENLDSQDDTSNILFKVQLPTPTGNYGTTYVKLVDKNGTEQDRATPGEDYKIRYYVNYTGPDIKVAVYRTETWTTTSHSSDGSSHTTHHSRQVFDHWDYPVKSIPLNAEIDRNIPPVHGYADIYKETVPKSSSVHHGDTFVYTTKAYRTYEVPIIKTTAQASSTLSTIAQDDYSSQFGRHAIGAEWHEFYDFAVSNVVIKPVSETPYKPGYQTYAVQYKITNKTPNWVPPYEKDVHTAIKLGNGQVMYFTDHVAQEDNTNITHEVKVYVDPATDKTLTGTVTINYDKMVWEEDVLKQKNDQASATTSVDSPYNPWGGPPVQHTGNAWIQTYNVHTWTGYNKKYADRSSQAFNIFTPGSFSSQSLSQNESYSITSIKFRSKLTTDTNQGNNGWVELTNGTVGMIKAGYGYELQITVNYKTNAFNQPQPSVSGGYSENGTWVRPFNVTPNLPNQLFVKTPDGQILSVDGYLNTNAGLDYSLSGDRTNSTWVYTIKAKDTLNINDATSKLFIDQNTIDGTYNLQVFTPAINGVPTKTAGSKLCDSKTVKIKVQGSDTDDLKSHIIQ